MKKMKKMRIMICLAVFIYFTVLEIVSPFIITTSTKEGGFQTPLSDNDFYKMVDNFLDPDEFSSFLKEAENINNVADFYNEISKSKEFQVISVFDQPLHTNKQSFRGGKQFYYNSEEFIEADSSGTLNIKAIQINKAAYNLNKIKIEEGQKLSWNQIDYRNDAIPVLLGNDYYGIYQIGETIHANYYSRDMKFEVAGFLKAGTVIDYQNTEFSLDSYILVPYPQALWNVGEDFRFESILYFAIINCDIIAQTDERAFFQEIKNISNKTGFTDFSIVGVSNFQIENIGLLLFVKENQTKIVLFLCLAMIGLAWGESIVCLKCFNGNYRKHFLIPVLFCFVLSVIIAKLIVKEMPLSGLVIGFIILLLLQYCVYKIVGKVKLNAVMNSSV